MIGLMLFFLRIQVDRDFVKLDCQALTFCLYEC
mgnify:CR=1 FL=1